MRATVIFGSPRKNGNTASLLKPVLEEMSLRGIEIDYFDVYEKKVGGCRACLSCQKDLLHADCLQKDDMEPVYNALVAADIIIIAAPIYAWSVPAPVKAVIDRMAYALCKYYGDNPYGPSLLEGKKLYIVTTCGYPVEKGADLHEEAMKRLCKHCKMIYGGMLCERHRNLKLPFMDEEKEVRARQFGKMC